MANNRLLNFQDYAKEYNGRYDGQIGSYDMTVMLLGPGHKKLMGLDGKIKSVSLHKPRKSKGII